MSSPSPVTRFTSQHWTWTLNYGLIAARRLNTVLNAAQQCGSRFTSQTERHRHVTGGAAFTQTPEPNTHQGLCWSAFEISVCCVYPLTAKKKENIPLDLQWRWVRCLNVLAFLMRFQTKQDEFCRAQIAALEKREEKRTTAGQKHWGKQEIKNL